MGNQAGPSAQGGAGAAGTPANFSQLISGLSQPNYNYGNQGSQPFSPINLPNPQAIPPPTITGVGPIGGGGGGAGGGGGSTASSTGSGLGTPSLTPELAAALQQYVSAAQQGTVEQYQTAIAPNVLSDAFNSGTIGGSANTQNWQLKNYDLANALGQVSSNIYGPALEQQQQLQSNQQIAQMQTEAQKQIAAQQLAGQEAIAQAQIQGQLSAEQAQIASAQLMQQAQLQSAQVIAQAQLQAQTQGQQLSAQVQELGLIPSLMQAAYLPGQQMSGVGTTLTQQLQNILNTGSTNATTQGQYPLQLLQTIGSLLGGIAGTGGTQVQVGPSGATGK